jgi:transcriptional regulator with XRE-family HTH domain
LVSRSDAVKKPAPSTFAERLEYSRDRQRVLGTWDSDGAMAEALGVSKASVSDYRRSETAPAVERTLAIARWVGVDPGWLAFGEETAAPAPDGFSVWMERRRAPRPAAKSAATLPVTRNPPALTSDAARRRRPGTK